MHTAVITQPDDFSAFRSHAKRLLAANAAPATVIWTDDCHDTLFQDAASDAECVAYVPRAFVALAEAVACHRSRERWSLLYQTLWRLAHGERSLLKNEADPLVHKINRMATAVRHDQHRMTAFVRFNAVAEGEDTHYIAWYEPQHYVLRRTADFFIDRFAAMRFSILTPDLSFHWDGRNSQFGPGMRRDSAAPADAMEEGWKRYYAAIFNPARSNPDLMARHMPRRFWRNLPEAASIHSLVADAGSRTAKMVERD
ncbi:MAG TPA: TIGR03915 family putative DNA repair protein [Rhodopila sp.]|nr:TIGR03915 family putative DNA repair protein [Rhodopila sp.]